MEPHADLGPSTVPTLFSTIGTEELVARPAILEGARYTIVDAEANLVGGAKKTLHRTFADRPHYHQCELLNGHAFPRHAVA